MAEEIRLVGSFQDNITPQLKKLTREINAVTKSFEKMGRKLRPISREMGRLAMSSQVVADNMKKQRDSITATTQAMRAYSTATRKANSAQKKFRPQSPSAPRGGGGKATRSKGGGGGVRGLGAAVSGNQIGNMLSNAIQRSSMFFQLSILLFFMLFHAVACFSMLFHVFL